DFLTFGDLKRPFNLLHSAGLEIFALQVLSPTELDPDVTGDLRMIDSETVQHLDVSSAADLLALYQEYRTAYEQNLSALCERRSGRFLPTGVADDLTWVLFDLLRRKGWIG